MTRTHPASSREGITLAKVLRFLSLPFCPAKFETYRAVKSFQDISIEALLADGVEGLLIDADGTLGPHHTRDFPESAVRHAERMQKAGLKVAIFTNATEDRFQQFSGVPVVSQVAAKPDPEGFLKAMRDYLHLTRPQNICMIGDNYITDGGAVVAGMRFIHVEPIPGDEPWFHAFTRSLAHRLVRLHFPGVFQ